jgi:hypothetical protein
MRVKQPDDAQTLTRQVAEIRAKKRKGRRISPTGKIASPPERPGKKGRRIKFKNYGDGHFASHAGIADWQRGGRGGRGDDTSRGA